MAEINFYDVNGVTGDAPAEDVNGTMTGAAADAAEEPADKPTADEPAEKPASKPTPKDGAGKQKIILAVDDSPFFLRSLDLMLKDSGYRIFCVNSGKAALEFVRRKYTPDLFILDIDMPITNGYDLAKRIKELGYTAPIIFLTGNAKEKNIIEAAKVGAADYIVKPLDKTQVLERINKHIGT
jgi:CheY-like chemotaxis protein